MEDKKLTAETARQIWSGWLKARAGKFTPGELMDECSDLLGRLQQRLPEEYSRQPLGSFLIPEIHSEGVNQASDINGVRSAIEAHGLRDLLRQRSLSNAHFFSGVNGFDDLFCLFLIELLEEREVDRAASNALKKELGSLFKGA